MTESVGGLATFEPPDGLHSAEIRSAVLDAVTGHSNNSARSLQRHMGPSQVGHPCSRNLVYSLSARTRPERHNAQVWPSYVGTAVHARLSLSLGWANLRAPDTWVYDQRVQYPRHRAVPSGSLDAYYVPRRAVIDFKILGETTFQLIATNPPSSSYWDEANGGGLYRTQVQCYGYGMRQLGFDVERVGLMIFGRSKRLSDAKVLTWAYDEAFAIRMLTRADAALVVAESGTDPLAIPAAPSAKNCLYCEWRGSEADGLCEEKPNG